MSLQLHGLVALRLRDSQTRAVALLALFVGVQIADACLTASGIDRFGLTAEANPILARSFTWIGPGAALILAKGTAIAGAVALYALSRHLLLAILTLMYVCIAVVPWAWALAIA